MKKKHMYEIVHVHICTRYTERQSDYNHTINVNLSYSCVHFLPTIICSSAYNILAYGI